MLIQDDEAENERAVIGNNQAPEPFDCDAVTEQYLKMRHIKAKMTKAYEDDKAVIEAEQERLESLMMGYLENHKVKSAPTIHGVFYKELQVKPSATDWTAFYKWIRENDAFEFLHKRISSEQVQLYLELHKNDPDGGLPPGIQVLKEHKIKVRTGKEK